ncbi:hypothetical protein WJX72_009237 [[Myrmecia] bisecta]|uniref:SURP and G-patch domain-containing protein 1-like protein n=1 Tax=[Myrmecia] bisecta TaxID=41462 RepID=A0AAW1Q126_9CHLO
MSGISFVLGSSKPSSIAGPKLAFGLKGAQKAKPLAVFQADSSDDEGDGAPDAKKQRTASNSTVGAAPPAPRDPEVQKVADKLAEFVSKNGRSFEEITRQRNPGDTPFKFLFEPSGPDFKYYEWKLRQYLGLGNGVGDSLAAMEAFTRLAAKHEESREEKEARVALLNETSFDRRRQVAVYKNDGTRGHHMQDFIPEEELAKFMTKANDPNAKAMAERVEANSKISADNKGYALLAKMGWKEGQGLGANASGMTAPIAAGGQGQEKLGLGAAAHGEVEEGDDAFETYRKRMMLGYKHRPNPLGNPRKAYY